MVFWIECIIFPFFYNHLFVAEQCCDLYRLVITEFYTLLEKPLNFDPFGHARFAHLFVLYD